eukprot:TRINITY_DN11978_c0_g1_i1.p1 TRINITY_DN11978_c0_g1~~TRINITY_DN11978_c0_g1_i1.p1  ORF type:complete len:687 (+),score=97.98 TRINITY_DN11978_c0_g1_i1:97-2157(+)
MQDKEESVQKCECSVVSPHGGDQMPEKPVLVSLLLPAGPCQPNGDVHPAAAWTTKRIAQELTTLQAYFLAAHEREIQELQNMLNGSSVDLSFEDLPTVQKTATGSTERPRRAAASLYAPSPFFGRHHKSIFSVDKGRAHQDNSPRLSMAAAAHHHCRREEEEELPPEHEDGGEKPCTSEDDVPVLPSKSLQRFSSEQLPSSSSTSRATEIIMAKGVSNGGSGRGSGSNRVTMSKSCAAEESMATGRARNSHLDSSLNAMISTIVPSISEDWFARRKSGQWLTVAFADTMYGFTEHAYFDLLAGAAIILNAFFIAYETNYALTQPASAPAPDWALVVGRLFTGFFVVELLCRMCGGLRRFFCSGSGWNYFDCIIVTFTVAEEFLQEAASLSNTRMVRLLRLTRTVKVLRMVRIVRVVGALRTLVNSLVGTIQQVVWAFFLIVCIVFVFGVLFGQMVGNARRSEDVELDEELLMWFWGTIPRCMYTLYMSVSGGISWWEAAEPLSYLGTGVLFSFLLYIALIQWVVLNVITGCFCESAAEAARKDVSLAVQNYRADRDHFLQRCKAIFRSIDADGSGFLDPDEMKPYLDSEPARALFAALDIDVGDAYGLFELLDEDGDDVIDLEEFMWGCMQLRGGAKALGIAQIQCQTKRLCRMLQLIMEGLRIHVPDNQMRCLHSMGSRSLHDQQ